jgi:hypothetical protein
MPISDTVKGALVGSLITGVITIGAGVLHYYFIDKPTLLAAQQTAANEETARRRAEDRARQQQEQFTALQKQAEELKRQFAIAKDQFISRVTDAVNDGGSKLPGSEPNKPVQITNDVINRVIIPRARHIVDERDKARAGIRQVSNNLDRVYDELDSDIDDLKKVIDTPPVDVKTVQMLLQKIADKWPTKVKLMEELALASLQQMGCPTQLAANP